jgi:hypothetical protein
MSSVSKTKLAFVLAASTFLVSSTAALAEGTCRDSTGKSFAAIPDTTPVSCNVGYLAAEYYGKSVKGEATLKCFWKRGTSSPIADGRFHMVHETAAKTKIEKTLIHLNDTVIAIKADPATNTIAVQSFNSSGMIYSKRCDIVDIRTFTVKGCTPGEEFTDLAAIQRADKYIGKKCAAFVDMLSAGREITNDMYIPSIARRHLDGVQQFFNKLGR